jgi:transcriptional regulator with XRE-family HTH domain
VPEQPPDLDVRREIGDRIRRHRLWANLTQDEIARRTSLDRRTVQRIERGETDARLSWLLRIAGAIGIPLAQLVEPRPPARGSQTTGE